MKKRLVGIIAVMLCFMNITPVAGAVDLTRQGSLTIEVNYNGTAIQGVKMTVCLVASAAEVNSGIVYTKTNGFAGSTADLSNLSNAADNQALSAQLDDYAAQNNISRNSGMTAINGKVLFSGLQAGLYLVAQDTADGSGYEISPALVPIPMQMSSAWNFIITVLPKAEPVGSFPTPTPTPSSGSSSGSEEIPAAEVLKPAETKPTEAPEVTEPTEAPEVTEPTEVPEVTEPTETPEEAELMDTPEETESEEVPEITEPSGNAETDLTNSSDTPSFSGTRVTPGAPPSDDFPYGTPELHDSNNILIIDEFGNFIELDESAVPLGWWIYDEETKTWIYEEFTPLGTLPQTGVLNWPVPVLSISGLLMFTLGWVMFRKGKKRQ